MLFLKLALIWLITIRQTLNFFQVKMNDKALAVTILKFVTAHSLHIFHYDFYGNHVDKIFWNFRLFFEEENRWVLRSLLIFLIHFPAIVGGVQASYMQITPMLSQKHNYRNVTEFQRQSRPRAVSWRVVFTEQTKNNLKCLWDIYGFHGEPGVKIRTIFTLLEWGYTLPFSKCC